jgi:hypothetical protein
MMRRGGKHQSGTVGCCLLGCFAFDEASGRCVFFFFFFFFSDNLAGGVLDHEFMTSV